MNHPEEFTKTTPNHIVKWVLKERQQLPNMRIHHAVTQTKAVARGGRVGPAEPALVPVQVYFGGKLDLIH